MVLNVVWSVFGDEVQSECGGGGGGGRLIGGSKISLEESICYIQYVGGVDMNGWLLSLP